MIKEKINELCRKNDEWIERMIEEEETTKLYLVCFMEGFAISMAASLPFIAISKIADGRSVSAKALQYGLDNETGRIVDVDGSPITGKQFCKAVNKYYRNRNRNRKKR